MNTWQTRFIRLIDNEQIKVDAYLADKRSRLSDQDANVKTYKALSKYRDQIRAWE